MITSKIQPSKEPAFAVTTTNMPFTDDSVLKLEKIRALSSCSGSQTSWSPTGVEREARTAWRREEAPLHTARRISRETEGQADSRRGTNQERISFFSFFALPGYLE